MNNLKLETERRVLTVRSLGTMIRIPIHILPSRVEIMDRRGFILYKNDPDFILTQSLIIECSPFHPQYLVF